MATSATVLMLVLLLQMLGCCMRVKVLMMTHVAPISDEGLCRLLECSDALVCLALLPPPVSSAGRPTFCPHTLRLVSGAARCGSSRSPISGVGSAWRTAAHLCVCQPSFVSWQRARAGTALAAEAQGFWPTWCSACLVLQHVSSDARTSGTSALGGTGANDCV